MRIRWIVGYGVGAIILCAAVGWSGSRGQHLGWWQTTAAGAWTVAGWAVDQPRVAAVVAVLALVPVIVAAVSSLTRRRVATDPVRMFSAAQRAEGFARAGHRCELEGWLWLRCRRPAEHADHFYPWSKGGATDMANLVAACTRCNTSKGATVPTRLQRLRLERRRRRYFPENLPTQAGGTTPQTPPSAYR